MASPYILIPKKKLPTTLPDVESFDWEPNEFGIYLPVDRV